MGTKPAFKFGFRFFLGKPLWILVLFCLLPVGLSVGAVGSLFVSFGFFE